MLQPRLLILSSSLLSSPAAVYRAAQLFKLSSRSAQVRPLYCRINCGLSGIRIDNGRLLDTCRILRPKCHILLEKSAIPTPLVCLLSQLSFSCHVFVWRFRFANGVPENRIFIEKDGVPISPFHDVPLYAKYVQL